MGTITQSIDVGSMFLMDLSVNESEISGEQSDNMCTVDKELIFSSGYDTAKATYQPNNNHQYQDDMDNNDNGDVKEKSAYANQLNSSSSSSSRQNNLIAYDRQDNQRADYLGNSLDRLARAIRDDSNIFAASTVNNIRNTTTSVMIVEPQASPQIVELQSTSSLSDESSYDSSLSASYTASSETADEDELAALDRASATTREDSGVIDIRDLDSQLNYFYDDGELQQQPGASDNGREKSSPIEQEKPISNITKATDLINNSANREHDYNTSSTILMKLPNRSINEPTNDNNKSNEIHHLSSKNTTNYRQQQQHHHHHHNHNHLNQSRASSSKKSVSASLPIEVPARQMKKDLKMSKMNLLNKNNIVTTNLTHNSNHSKRNSIKSHDVDDDVDEFLEQEYNENHHNHYPIDEYPEERLRAEDDPMKLFESIQAMARSLHEDIELFGSLPPKRLLESPIWTANRNLGAGWA